MGYIYVFEFPNGKRYVGQTMNPKSRFSKYHYRGKVRESIDFFGWDKVKKHIWEVPDSQMDDLERFLISVYKSTDPDFGYNNQTGGKSGSRFKQSEEARIKNSEAHKGDKNPMYGKPKSEETRRKMSEAQKGVPKSEESRRKMSEARKAYYAKKKGLV